MTRISMLSRSYSRPHTSVGKKGNIRHALHKFEAVKTAVGKTVAGKMAAGKTVAGETAVGKTSGKTAARKTAA